MDALRVAQCGAQENKPIQKKKKKKNKQKRRQGEKTEERKAEIIIMDAG